MIRIYKYLLVSALIALLCSCEADYKPDDLFGDWHENTGDSISLSLHKNPCHQNVVGISTLNIRPMIQQDKLSRRSI